MVVKITQSNTELELKDFVKTYSTAYFLGNDKIDGIRYQQTWKLVEDEVLKDRDICDYENFKKWEESLIKGNNIRDAIRSIISCSDGKSNIDPVYAITILFFISNGKYPIYDRFVLTSLNAIKENRCPKHGDSKTYLNMRAEEIIDTYINCYIPEIDCLLKQLQEKPNNHLNYRELDRALWVYGHGVSK